jgi:hypothetical protein
MVAIAHVMCQPSAPITAYNTVLLEKIIVGQPVKK